MGVVGGDVGDGPYCLKHVAEDVDDGQVHDGVEAAQPRVGRDAAEDGKEVDEHDEDVVYADGLVVRPAQVVAQVQQQDGWGNLLNFTLFCRERWLSRKV